MSHGPPSERICEVCSLRGTAPPRAARLDESLGLATIHVRARDDFFGVSMRDADGSTRSKACDRGVRVPPSLTPQDGLPDASSASASSLPRLQEPSRNLGASRTASSPCTDGPSAERPPRAASRSRRVAPPGRASRARAASRRGSRVAAECSHADPRKQRAGRETQTQLSIS